VQGPCGGAGKVDASPGFGHLPARSHLHPGPSPVRLTNRAIGLFWGPLAATWLMIAVEGPFLAAVIARLPDPTFNLAAHGVAFAFAILVEAPVIMLLSAATALVEDRESLIRLRRFAFGLSAAVTGVLLIVLIPAVHRTLMRDVMGLPPEVADLTYGALWLYLPWPAAIGYRRFYQGVLVREGRTRQVAYGTALRLVAMTGSGTLAAVFLDIPGAWVGAIALSSAVVAEATVVRFMVSDTLAEVLARPRRSSELIGFWQILEFYYPLALTSLIGLAVHPMLTFFMGRAASPVPSLAVFPVVNALSFVFRAIGLSYQDATIAMIGSRHEHYPELRRFGTGLGLATTALLALVVFTPLADVWFITISGLTPELAQVALLPARIIVLLPGLSVLLSFQRGILVRGRRTKPITVATALEVGTVAVVFPTMAWGVGAVGATSAFTAFLVGRAVSTTYLLPWSRSVLRSGSAEVGLDADSAEVGA